jgi:hypothetical protein
MPECKVEPCDFEVKTLDEICEWFQADPEPTPLHLFPLHTDEGRRGFLSELYDIGGTAIFAASHHVWDSLAKPQSARCTSMGITAHTGGKGKTALMKVLQQFVAEALAIDNPLPARSDFTTLDEWHAAAMQSFEQDNIDLGHLLARYSDILDGGSGDVAPPVSLVGELCQGPWCQEQGS